MTELSYKTLNNFGWNERDIKGRLLRDQIENLDIFFMTHLDLAISDAKDHHGRKEGQFIVYDFTLDQHNPEGYHPKGRAADGVFRGLGFLESFIIIDRWHLGGFGIYPHTQPDRIIHNDNRDELQALRWVRTKTEYKYDPIFFQEQLLAERLLSD